MPGETPTRIFVYSHPRTRSNLFMRLLETHPKIVQSQYPFMFAFQDGPDAQWSEEKRKKRKQNMAKPPMGDSELAKKTYQAGLDEMQQLIVNTEAEGKICVVKEHSIHLFASKFLNQNINEPREEFKAPVIIDHKLDLDSEPTSEATETPYSFPIPNPTLLPDRFVASLAPVIIIRHPVYTYPSYVRASSTFGGTVYDSDFPVLGSFRWQKVIYDFYRAYYDSLGKKDWPIVIDGDNLADDTKGQMQKFCAIAGLDESLIQYSWDVGEKPSDPVFNAFVGTIKTSSGVIKGPEGPPNLEGEVKKWTQEWDEKVAHRIRDMVESSIADYEYVLKFSI